MQLQDTNGAGLRIGVVGGSIAGCTAAVVLARAGHRVTVFERSKRELQGRGAGIATTPAVFQQLVDQDILDADLPRFLVKEIPHVGRSQADPWFGRTAGVLPIQLDCLNWGDLQRNLRKRVQDASYRKGCKVAAVTNRGDQAAVVALSDGSAHTFDLVVCADGYQSLGRRTLFPDVELEYRGYILWRGVLEERDLSDSAPLESMIRRVGYGRAHGVFYFVPGVDGSVEPGRRWLNWALYMPVPAGELGAFLTDRHGRRHDGSLAPGDMGHGQEAALKQMARDALPGYYADIIGRSGDTFVQAIYIVKAPSYRKGRICLVGDAGSVAPPFTASGVFKSISNAIDLAEALRAGGTLDEALDAWDEAQTRTGVQTAVIGEHLERKLIWEVPDFGTMDGAAFKAWQASMSNVAYARAAE